MSAFICPNCGGPTNGAGETHGNFKCESCGLSFNVPRQEIHDAGYLDGRSN